MKIKLYHVYPPIPDRRYDWLAVDDDTYDGTGGVVGFGETQQEAIKDLQERVSERELEQKENGG